MKYVELFRKIFTFQQISKLGNFCCVNCIYDLHFEDVLLQQMVRKNILACELEEIEILQQMKGKEKFIHY